MIYSNDVFGKRKPLLKQTYDPIYFTNFNRNLYILVQIFVIHNHPLCMHISVYRLRQLQPLDNME